MIEMEGQLLNLGTTDLCGRKFSKDCKITFPDEAIVYWDFDKTQPVGIAQVYQNDEGISCSVKLVNNELFTKDEYNVGGFYHDVKSHEENGLLIIDECKLISVNIVTRPSDVNLKITRKNQDL